MSERSQIHEDVIGVASKQCLRFEGYVLPFNANADNSAVEPAPPQGRLYVAAVGVV